MSSEDTITRLLDLIDSLRSENASLQEIIFKQQGLIDEKVIVPEAAGVHVGREPWYIQKAKLERIYKAPKPGDRDGILDYELKETDSASQE